MALKAKLLVSLDTARDSAFGDVRIVASLNSLLHLLVRLLSARPIFCSTVTYYLCTECKLAVVPSLRPPTMGTKPQS